MEVCTEVVAGSWGFTLEQRHYYTSYLDVIPDSDQVTSHWECLCCIIIGFEMKSSLYLSLDHKFTVVPPQFEEVFGIYLAPWKPFYDT